MTQYEVIIACVACTNLVLTLLGLYSGRHKATTARIEALERALRDELAAHDNDLTALKTARGAAITHDHLADVYKTVNTMARQLDTMAGEQQAMNLMLRQMVAAKLGLP